MRLPWNLNLFNLNCHIFLLDLNSIKKIIHVYEIHLKDKLESCFCRTIGLFLVHFLIKIYNSYVFNGKKKQQLHYF